MSHDGETTTRSNLSPARTRNAEPVVITGRGLVSALGLDLATTWRNLCAGQSGLGPLTALEQQPEHPKTGGQAQTSNCELESDPPRPREVTLLRKAICEATGEAGVALSSQAPTCPAERCGLVFGTTLHGMRAGGAFFRQGCAEPLRHFQAAAVLEQAADDLGCRGIATTTCAACSSGLSSVALGVTLLQAGQLDLVIAGGYDPISEYAYAGFNSLRLVADEPPRPFGLDRPGMKLGEGYGVVTLERLSDAQQRDATPLGQIMGFGESADAHHLTQPHPEGRGAIHAIRLALEDSGVETDDIGLVTAHATGTPDNDRGEFVALRSVFGDRLPDVPVAALKSRLGHTLGGAGTVELILALSALRDQCVPPTDNVDADRLEYPDLRFARDYAEPATIRAAMNLSIGFGGANTCVIVGPPPADTADAAPEIVTRNSDTRRDVAITGIGVVLPGVIGNDALIAYADRERATPTSMPESIDDAPLLDLLQTPRVRRMSEYVKLSLSSARLACRDAGLDGEGAFGPDDAVLAGTTHGSADYCADYYRQIVEEGIDAANPMLFAEGVPNAGAAHLSLLFGLTGPCQTIIGSRTAGLEALHLAATRIGQGRWTRAMVGAAEEATDTIRTGYAHCGLHTSNPNGDAFSDRAGFALGSGAVTLMLEDRAAAEARGATIHGIISATAAGFAPAGDARATIEHTGAMYHSIGKPDHVVTSANGTWVGRAEGAAVAHATGGATVTSLHGHFAETFSVGPFAAIAWTLLTGRLPRLLGEPPGDAKLRPAEGDESPDAFAVLSTDYAGPLAAATIRRPG